MNTIIIIAKVLTFCKPTLGAQPHLITMTPPRQ